MHGGTGQEVLQTNVLAGGGFSSDRSDVRVLFFRGVIKGFVLCFGWVFFWFFSRQLNAKAKLASDGSRRRSSLSLLINPECAPDGIFLSE